MRSTWWDEQTRGGDQVAVRGWRHTNPSFQIPKLHFFIPSAAQAPPKIGVWSAGDEGPGDTQAEERRPHGPKKRENRSHDNGGRGIFESSRLYKRLCERGIDNIP